MTLMQTRYGFIASDKLVQLIREANDRLAQGQNSKDPMYTYRNKLIEQVTDELIDNMVMGMARQISDTERREGLMKLGNTIQSVVHKIVSVMLSKDKDNVVLQSKPFLEESVAKDADGNIRMGFEVPSAFYNNMLSNFDTILTGNMSPELVKNIQGALKEFDDMVLSHFMIKFVKTLGWGMIKMNLAKGAKATITKADSMMIDQMVPKLSMEELQEIAPHIKSFFFESNILGQDVLK